MSDSNIHSFAHCTAHAKAMDALASALVAASCNPIMADLPYAPLLRSLNSLRSHCATNGEELNARIINAYKVLSAGGAGPKSALFSACDQLHIAHPVYAAWPIRNGFGASVDLSLRGIPARAIESGPSKTEAEAAATRKLISVMTRAMGVFEIHEFTPTGRKPMQTPGIPSRQDVGPPSSSGHFMDEDQLSQAFFDYYMSLEDPPRVVDPMFYRVALRRLGYKFHKRDLIAVLRRLHEAGFFPTLVEFIVPPLRQKWVPGN